MSFLAGTGYRMEQINGKQYTVHRVLWETFNGPIPEGMQIDHINGVRGDNTLTNLRLVTKRENQQNAKINTRNTSGALGVGLNRGKWCARICTPEGRKTLGRYDDWFEAVCARMSANNRYGYHENHGRRR